MSDITAIIRAAMDCGVTLQYIDGRLKAAGKQNVLREWAPRLRPYREKLIAALAPTPEPGIDWRPLASAYHTHHFKCASCIAAGKGFGLRCGTGRALWAAYQSTDESKTP